MNDYSGLNLSLERLSYLRKCNSNYLPYRLTALPRNLARITGGDQAIRRQILEGRQTWSLARQALGNGDGARVRLHPAGRYLVEFYQKRVGYGPTLEDALRMAADHVAKYGRPEPPPPLPVCCCGGKCKIRKP